MKLVSRSEQYFPVYYSTGMTPVRGLAPALRIQFDCAVNQLGESVAVQARVLDLETRMTSCIKFERGEWFEFEPPHLVEHEDAELEALAAGGDRDAEHLLGNLRWITTNQVIFDGLVWQARQVARARPYQLGYEDCLPWSIYAPGEPQRHRHV